MMPSKDELRRDFLCTANERPIFTLEEARAQGPLGPASIAIGAFDGVHAGHRELIDRTVSEARSCGRAAYAVTFDPDPDQVVSPHPVDHLLPMKDRLRLLSASGVDGVIVVPFTRELAALNHVSFFEDVLFGACTVEAIHVGSDFRLGAGGASDVSVIRAWGVERGINVFGHDLVTDAGTPISATRIRRYLACGDVRSAAQELGRRYAVSGTVCAGRHEGTGFGFPTANIEVPSGIQLPLDGVYAGLAAVDGMAWPAAINVGLPPTFSDHPESAQLEANLIGFTGELYGRDCTLAFDRRIRPSMRFDSTEELISTVLGNIEDIRATFGEGGVRFDR